MQEIIGHNDIVHYMLNRSDYKDSEITIDYTDVKISERNLEEIKEKLESGYKPYSSWFEAMAKKLKYQGITRLKDCDPLQNSIVCDEVEFGFFENVLKVSENENVCDIIEYSKSFDWVKILKNYYIPSIEKIVNGQK